MLFRSETGDTSMFGTVSFKNGDATLSKVQQVALSKVNINTTAVITVVGYSSKSGSTKANLALSKKRADVIAAQIKKLVPGVKVVASGAGSKTNKACAKFDNRCAVISITQKPTPKQA